MQKFKSGDDRRRRAIFFRSALLGLLLGILVLTTGAVPGQSAGESVYPSLGTFSEVLSLVRGRYVEPVDVTELYRGAFHGMTSTLDPLSDYVPPERLTEFRRQLDSPDPGIGVVLTRRYGYAAIAAVVAGGPAAAAGLSGDELLEAVDGRSTRDLALWEVEGLLTGESGSAVELTVVRSSRAGRETLTVVRQHFSPAGAESREHDGETLVFVPRQLDAEVVVEFDRLLRAGRDRLVLDLRGCGGEDLEAAVAFASRLAESGQVFAREQGRSGPLAAWSTRAVTPGHDGPVVVLIDGGTRGGAEVLAGFLQQIDRAPLVGRPTSGLSGRRRLVALPSGGAVYLTVARYHPAGGEEAIGAVGLRPDEWVYPLVGGDDEDGDEVLDRALEVLVEEPAPRS